MFNVIYAECRLQPFLLSAIKPNVVLLNAVAPFMNGTGGKSSTTLSKTTLSITIRSMTLK
jgi:hypothetical protein